MKHIVLALGLFFLRNPQNDLINGNGVIGKYQTKRHVWILKANQGRNGQDYFSLVCEGCYQEPMVFYYSYIKGGEEVLCNENDGCYGLSLIFKGWSPAACKGGHYTSIEFHYYNGPEWEGKFLCQ